jgi:glycosyltransferase involved in cell wall biosynthesis
VVMEPTLTVFTPAYNRAYTLHLCYESLKRQTSQDFEWLIIDDGSTDNTKDMVGRWIKDGLIEIRYYYQENQGMHGAHNTAYEKIKTELNVCVDSDDYLADDAVEKIVTFWTRYGGSQYAGIVGLDAKPDGEVIGTRMPENLNAATHSDLYGKYGVKGDKKLVYRSDLTRKAPPYPIFPDEKYCPLSFKYILIDQECPLLIMNEVLCHVEYLDDGSSMNIIKQYKRNPNGFSFFRKTAMQFAPSPKEKFREAIHYVSSNMILKNRRYLLESPCKWTTFIATPLGIMLYVYIQSTKKSTVLKNN